MSLLIRQPARLFKNVRRMSRLGNNPRSRRLLARHMFQANLKRLHHGWSSLANRLMGKTTVTVQLQLERIMPFCYRSGTTDLLVLEQVFLDGEYDVGRMAPENVEYIVDLGSNIGLTAIFWAQRYPHAQMALVEPDPDNFKLLEMNTAAFHDRCVLIKAAVSDGCGRTSFFRSEREYGHSMLRTDDCVSEIEVRTLTVPDVVDEAGFPRVDLLKMDIEGGEQIVMPTLSTWRAAPRYLIAELHPPYDFKEFTRDCRSAGLRATESAAEGFRSNLPFATCASVFQLTDSGASVSSV
ncbi:MAG TPA: FkbM family methyltransferase [Candidatus Acidoferrum sp.]|nr:FkbM family methyltransferase [Candidatus Acidoferrum sp.]